MAPQVPFLLTARPSDFAIPFRHKSNGLKVSVLVRNQLVVHNVRADAVRSSSAPFSRIPRKRDYEGISRNSSPGLRCPGRPQMRHISNNRDEVFFPVGPNKPVRATFHPPGSGSIRGGAFDPHGGHIFPFNRRPKILYKMRPGVHYLRRLPQWRFPTSLPLRAALSPVVTMEVKKTVFRKKRESPPLEVVLFGNSPLAWHMDHVIFVDKILGRPS